MLSFLNWVLDMRCALVILCILAFPGLQGRGHVAYCPFVQPVVQPGATDSGPQGGQDAVDALRRNRDPYYVIRPIALELYKDRKSRDGMRDLMKDETLPANVFTALALVFSEKDDREPIPWILRALVTGRLDESDEIIQRFTLTRYHQAESIFPDVEKLIRELGPAAGEKPAPGFRRSVSVLLRLVEGQRFREDRPEPFERYLAMDMILRIWSAWPAAGKGGVGAKAFSETLSHLVNDAVTFSTLGEWQGWFEPYRRKKRREQSLSLARIYGDLLRKLRQENQLLRESRRAEVTALMERMKAAGEPPTRFLLDRDAALRRLALVTFKSMADSLEASRRTAAIKGLIEGLKRDSLSEELYRGLLETAGAVGQKAGKEEKSALVEALFRPRRGDVAGTWAARLKAVGELGFMDRENRLSLLYNLANEEKNRGNEGWRLVRLNVIKLAQQLRMNLGLVVRALKDSDPEVRGIAAVVISVVNEAWLGDTVGALLAAAAMEKEVAAFRRMLDAVEVTVRRKPAVVSADHVKALLALPFPATEARTLARFDAVLTAFRAVEGAFESLRPDAEALVARAAAVQDKALAEKLRQCMVKNPSALVIAPLISWLGGPGMADPRNWTATRDLLFKQLDQGKSWLGHLKGVWDMLGRLSSDQPALAAETSHIVLTAAEKLPRLPTGMTMAQLVLDHEKWVLKGGRPDLWERVLARRAALVKEKPRDVELLMGHAALAERLAPVWQDKWQELLTTALKDRQTSIPAGNGAEADARRRANQLAVARLLILLNRPEDAHKALTALAPSKAPGSERLWYEAALVVLEKTTDEALRHLGAIPRDQAGNSPKTLAWLVFGARVLSSDPSDWPDLEKGGPPDLPAAFRELLKNREARRREAVDILKAKLEGNPKGGKSEKVPDQVKSPVVYLGSLQCAALMKKEPGRAQLLSAFLVELTGNDKLAWPKEASAENLALLTKELASQRAVWGLEEKLRQAFLKSLAPHLYSLD